jgi:enoyl-CoA hydratase/carnithine racemase
VTGPADASIDPPVLYTVTNRIAVITLNRPARLNAWSPQLEAAYVRCLRRASIDSGVRALVITGAGTAFCAGADTKVLHDITTGHPIDAPGEPGRPRRLRMYEFEPAVPKPVIAAVNGACVGIGLSHALMCDLRFTVPDARWSAPFARLGLAAEQGSAWTLQRLVGYSRAADLLLSGRTITGDEAHRIGLADELVDGDVVSAAVAYASDLVAHCSPAAMATIKGQLQRASSSSLPDACDDAEAIASDLMAGADFKEGVQALRERRPASFEPLPGEVDSPN